MKKIISSILTAAMLLPIIPAHAAPGDIAGNLYYTDIKTYIYHSPITSYNIGGKTVIDAEILNWHYGFDVYWYADTRRLEIIDKGGEFNSLQAMSGELVEGSEGKVGDISGQYYETDIVTTLNGREIEAYNIGGRTFFVAEGMRDFGYIVDWDETERALTVSKPADFYKIETDYGTVKSMYPQDNPTSFTKYDRGPIFGKENDDNEYMLSLPSGMLLSASSAYYVKLSDVQTAFNADCRLIEDTWTGHTGWVNGIEYDTDYYTYRLDFNYDSASEIETEKINGEDERQNTERVEFSSGYRIDLSFYVNGEEIEPKIPWGYNSFSFHALVLDGEIYIPAHEVCAMLGFDYAY